MQQRRTHSTLDSNNDPHGSEELLMWFENAGDFTGWNQGEGCVAVNGTYYTAWASGIDGKAGNVFNKAGGGTVTAASAAHSILLQMGTSSLQRWQMQRTNIDWTGNAGDELRFWCPGPNNVVPKP